MEKFLRRLLVVMITPMIFYLIGGFVSTEWNTSEWGLSSRWILVSLTILVYVIYWVLFDILGHSEKNK